jgi:anaphase-promoting complex subunit 3
MRKRQGVNVQKSVEKTEEVEEEEEWTAAQEQQAQEAFEQSLAQYYIYSVTRTFALALFHLSTFSSSDCLWTLSVLPPPHQSTSLSLSLIARAHYEVQDYRSSERAFKALRWKEKYRVWDMEVYSSLLWQMGRGVELAFLAREMVDLAPGSGEAWIVVGNLFSVRKERERALGCFRRATELAVKGSVKAYAYTLCGHESLDEDLGSAMRYFERALRVDGGRHYNAWYGLGTCYLRMGKVRTAEYHFRRAVGVNGGSAVLLGCVGLAVERRGGVEEALGWFERAVEVSEGRNALVRFRRAKIYVKLRRYEASCKRKYIMDADGIYRKQYRIWST